jgi:hypothetical protein
MRDKKRSMIAQFKGIENKQTKRKNVQKMLKDRVKLRKLQEKNRVELISIRLLKNKILKSSSSLMFPTSKIAIIITTNNEEQNKIYFIFTYLGGG